MKRPSVTSDARMLTRLSVLLLLGVGCAGVQRVPLKREVVLLPNGRFIGPLEIQVPRRADHGGHDFEIFVTLRTRCAPLLTLAFPDGETEELGSRDRTWQDLLARRAKIQPAVVVEAPAAAAVPAVESGQAPVAVATQPAAGHWVTTPTDSWPGQLAYERTRGARCAVTTEHTARHLNAFDESGTIALWADVPQELFAAELVYEIVELVPPAAPAPRLIAAEPLPAPAPSPRPRPPPPAPKSEQPDPPADAAATWQAGSWVWVEGDGRWVWHEGWWLAPAKTPALKVELTGNPPNAGCTWVPGYWTWEGRGGRWVWQGGHWKAPPPRDEVRGTSPGEGAPWHPGHWIWSGTIFVWVDGHWGKPPLRAENVPPPPFPGAQWIPGDWIRVKGVWVWSAGFYPPAQRPPPPRAEVPPPSPAPQAIWLQGYWRWDGALHEHQWVAGHWELPPGEGYVWIPDPVAPGGIMIRGHWELRVRINR
jgi:hypothetical protein